MKQHMKHWMFIPTLFLLLNIAISTTANANTTKLIQLKYRTAESIIPLVKPFLKPNDGISGEGFQLFIKTDAKTLSEIRSIIYQLDNKPIELLISIKSPHASSKQQNQFNLDYSGQYAHDDRNVNVYTNINTRDNNTQKTRERYTQIRTQAGKHTVISEGLAIPVVIQQPTKNREIIHRDVVKNGLAVTARLTKQDMVILEIEPHIQQNYKNKQLQSNRVSTTLHGKLGEWIAIGGTNENTTSSQNSSTGIKRIKTKRSNAIEIRVEKLENNH